MARQPERAKPEDTVGANAAKDAGGVAPGSAMSPLRVVAIGASAGGLESLERLFASLPGDTGMAFVVVQHLSPDFRSMMDELLGRRSVMPVALAEDGERVLPNRVYLLPPKKDIVIRDGALVLTDRDPAEGLALPIDRFFRSLASDAGERGVAIVLSGTGSDGSRGIVDVKRAGGKVFVESAASAKFDGMPASARATGVADVVCESGQLANALLGRPIELDDASDVLDHSAMTRVFESLRSGFGIDFTHYRQSTIGRRVERRLARHAVSSIEDYLAILAADPGELTALFEDLLIGVTEFFRDPEAFETLRRDVLPQLVEQAESSVRVWVAGCATGEEAYSIAILVDEAVRACGRPLAIKILATDVHRGALDRASLGRYGMSQLTNVSEARLAEYFVPADDGYRVSAHLRQLVVFAPHDVTRDAPFTRMDLITCRNLLIYLEPPLQSTVLSLFHFGLRKDGMLFLGASETPGVFASEFDVVDERAKVFRKLRDVRLLGHLNLPIGTGATGRERPSLRPRGGPDLLPLYDQLLDRCMPPSFLVDEDQQLVDSYGGAERLLKLGRRRPSTGILDLLEGDLRISVMGALQRVLRQRETVHYARVFRSADADAGAQWYALHAEPIVHPRSGALHVLVRFEVEQERATSEPDGDETPTARSLPKTFAASPRASVAQGHIDALEGELSYTKENLQNTVEELQTTNEELQATNEELVASNEELQSTNEELHSVNQELHTVNAEYQRSIGDLKAANADIHHLLESTEVGTLFLDGELRIRKFTRQVGRAFAIDHRDLGRRIHDLSHRLERPRLFEEIERALKYGDTVEEEARTIDGTSLFLRVLPYRMRHAKAEAGATEESIAGVVVTLTDISPLDRAHDYIQRLSAIVESSDDAIIGKDLDGTIITWNRGAERIYGYSAEEVVGRNITILAPEGHEGEIENVLDHIRRGARVDHLETVRLTKDGQLLDVSVTISPIHGRDGTVVGASAISRDITPLKRALRDLAREQDRIRLLLDSTAEAIFGLDRAGICTFCNRQAVRQLGYQTTDDLVGKEMHELVHHSHEDGSRHAGSECPILQAMATGMACHSDSDVLWRADGSSFPSEYWSHPIINNGVLEGAVVTFLDITQRKEAQEALQLEARRREQFLAMLSHELRNPLAAVLNATRLMQAHSDPDSVEMARGVIERQSQHMSRLLDDLLDVSRITRGAFELRMQDVDLRTSIDAAIEATEPMRSARDIQLCVEVPERPLMVRGDPSRLQQVVANLLSNAIRYSPPRSEVRIEAGQHEGNVEIRVLDRGRGIEPELIGRIFELFVQTAQGLDRSEGGLGVGLALVDRIVELHGGSVRAHSEGPGMGSSFTVRLPSQPAREPAKPQPRATKQTPKKIVVVEDHDDSRDMLRLLLEAKGHEVLEATDGRSALEVITRERPAIALVDIGLPGMSGYDVAREIRSNAALDGIMLVALTGYGAPTDVRKAQEAGFDRHLTKPADLGAIDRILSE